MRNLLGFVRGWRNTVGNLIDMFRLEMSYRRPQFTGICVNTRTVQFHRTRGFKQYYFNSKYSAFNIILNIILIHLNYISDTFWHHFQQYFEHQPLIMDSPYGYAGQVVTFWPTPSPPTKSSGFRSFDSSRLLILKGGNSHVR